VLDKAELEKLIQIRKNLAAGSTTKLYASRTEYIFRRNGTPGLVTYINNESADMERKVQTTWANKLLKDYTGSNPDVTTDASGFALVRCKANSYSVYAPK
jgi:alpha-amylase